MDKRNMYVSVTESGGLYDRTNGRNDRIILDKKYYITNGSVVFTRSGGLVRVTRYAINGELGYVKDISEPGFYIITAISAQAIPKVAKEARILYNKLKSIVGPTQFKIIDTDKMTTPIRIQLFLDSHLGRVTGKFVVKFNPTMINEEFMERIVSIVQGASELDFKMVLKAMNYEGQKSMILTINEEFIERMKNTNYNTRPDILRMKKDEEMGS